MAKKRTYKPKTKLFKKGGKALKAKGGAKVPAPKFNRKKIYNIGGIVSGIGGMFAAGAQRRAGREQFAAAQEMHKKFKEGNYELSDAEKNLLQQESSELKKLQKMDYRDTVGESLESREEQRQANLAQFLEQTGKMGGPRASAMMNQMLRSQEQTGAQEFANLQAQETAFEKDVSTQVVAEQQQINQQEAALKQQTLQEIKSQEQIGKQMEFEGTQAMWEAGSQVVGSGISMAFPGFAKEGMKVKAGEPELTPGKESHSSNPIDLVQKGTKIGEMTGGEVIMPSKDVKTVKKFIEKGDAKSLMSLMSKLFTKWEKEANEHSDKTLKAKSGAKVPMSFDGSAKQTKIKY